MVSVPSPMLSYSFIYVTPSLPNRTFNCIPQSYRLGTTSVGDYIFVGNVVLKELRLVNIELDTTM